MRARAPLRAVPVGVDIVVGVIAVSVIADVVQVFARKAERDAERKAVGDADKKKK